MNIYNTIKQVPKDAMVQISGLNSYWFLKKNKLNVYIISLGIYN